MGKKRRDSSKRYTQVEEDVEEEGKTVSLTLFSCVIFFFMGFGFCLGVGPNLQMPVTDLCWAIISSIPLTLYGIGHSMKRIVASPGDDMYNIPFSYVNINGQKVRDDASHPLVFAALREAIIREEGGFVHPDLGLLIPAPSGGTRGIGMVRDGYSSCQVRCMPGIAHEKQRELKNELDALFPPAYKVPVSLLDSEEKVKNIVDTQQSIDDLYLQEEILIKIPLSYQMTRTLALKTLLPLMPMDVLQRAPPKELDDAALLVLLLAHERGLGQDSIFHPYIATLPVSPTCGYSPIVRSQVLQTIELMGIELGMDVNGWPGEISKASERAQMIADGLSKDYGAYISVPEGATAFSVIQWALCQVASRATAGFQGFGSLRLVPMVDMVSSTSTLHTLYAHFYSQNLIFYQSKFITGQP